MCGSLQLCSPCLHFEGSGVQNGGIQENETLIAFLVRLPWKTVVRYFLFIYFCAFQPISSTLPLTWQIETQNIPQYHVFAI